MVYVLLANGFEQVEMLTPVDMMRRAGVSVATVGVYSMSVKSSHGVELSADIPLSEVSLGDMELLMLPGGQPGVDNLWESEEVRELVKKAYESGKNIAAICAAPMILARLGILDGREAVCYPACSPELSKARFLPNCGVAKDGKIITGRACGDSFEFAFAIVEELCGKDAADKIKKAICYE